MESGIYALVNQSDGKRYIGRTVNFRKRKNDHFWMLANNRHFNNHLQRAWNRGDEIRFEIIERCAPEFCNDREIYWIAEYKSDDSAHGYNQCEGGQATTGYHFTAEQKAKISEKNKGRKFSAEVVRRRVDTLKKRMENDPEFAERITKEKSARWKGKPSWNKGIPCPEWLKERNRKSMLGRTVTAENKEKLRELYSGEKSITAKLRKSDVVSIRYRFLCGERQCEILKDYPNVTPQTIYDIVRNRRWKSVPNTKNELEKLI